MNALTPNTGPAPTPANPEANPTTTLIIDTPTAKTAHATLRSLQKSINANVGERVHTEEDILAVAHALGLSLISSETNVRATNNDYGLPASPGQAEEVFFHVCFLPPPRHAEAGPRKAGFLTIYIHPLARASGPTNQ